MLACDVIDKNTVKSVYGHISLKGELGKAFSL